MLASSKIRKPKILKAAKAMLQVSREEILHAGENTRLHCIISEHEQYGSNHKRPFVVLIHGWEGSAESSYILSSAACLYNNGYDVLRLHLRDHGPSHHLNTELFHGALIDEVVMAVKSINKLFPRESTYLVGFSLGGNFALRVAMRAKNHDLKLTKVIAISPVIEPINTMIALEKGAFVYRTYFMRKWRKSLKLKHQIYPEKVAIEEVNSSRDLMALTEMLVEQHTEFNSVDDYFHSYALTGSALSSIEVPTLIITSKDDPVIPINDFYKIKASPNVTISIQTYGGHCGFIKDYKLNSWVNDVLLQQFDAYKENDRKGNVAL
ncbi:MAG: putative alpha/beta-fold hydrolase [Oleiphilaceae bacterium]|jgi:predicted alpha/beta-fold hydrolase